MKFTTTTLACLALLALVQAVQPADWPKLVDELTGDVDKMADEVRAQVEEARNEADQQMYEVDAKGPEFAKCSQKFDGAKDEAYERARAGIESCRQASLKQQLALGDVTQQMDAPLVAALGDAGRCMLTHARAADAEVSRLSAELAECDRRVGLQFTALPTVRRSWWVRNRRKVWTTAGRVAVITTIG